jgi:hypothetical protein
MDRNLSIEKLLRWRAESAEADAPPPPRAAVLLDLVTPWWELWPERFRAAAEKLAGIRVSYGYAMVEPQPGRSGHPVPALISRDDEDLEAPARVLYMSVRDGRLRLRFQLDPIPRAEPGFDVTFVSDDASIPPLSAYATLSVDNEYRLDAELPEDLARLWQTLKVTDQMPFRFILRPGPDIG